MTILLYLGIAILALVVLVTVIGFILPKMVHVERSRMIKADADVLFHEVADFEKFVKWSPWSDKDPNMKQVFEGEKMSVGSKYSWKGNRQVGEGYMEITHLEVNERIEMDLNFGPRGIAKCTFLFEPIGGETKVRWIMDSDMGSNPAARIFGSMMDKLVGKDFAQGLENLAQKTENK